MMGLANSVRVWIVVVYSTLSPCGTAIDLFQFEEKPNYRPIHCALDDDIKMLHAFAY